MIGNLANEGMEKLSTAEFLVINSLINICYADVGQQFTSRELLEKARAMEAKAHAILDDAFELRRVVNARQ